MTALVGLLIIVGLVVLVCALLPGSGSKVALGAGGLLALLLFMSFFYFSRARYVERPVAVRQELRTNRHSSGHDEPRESLRVSPSRIEVRPEYPAASDTNATSEHAQPTPGTTAEKPSGKPAWLVEGLQTGHGVTQFPVSSELFATVAECQRDLDSRIPQAIADEIQRVTGESLSLPLTPEEVRLLGTETYTEEIPISQGVWYKVHRLVKVDRPAWAAIQARWNQAKQQERLETLGVSFGGLLLVIGVVYLILRRPPRVVDPTLETFSTT